MSSAASFLDLAAFVVAVVLAVWGAKTGLIGELFRFGGMAGGFFAAFLYYRDLQAHMKAVSSNGAVTGVIAFLLIFIAVLLAVLAIGFALKKFTELIMLGWIDRLLGAALGLLKAALIAWAVCLSIASMPFDRVQAQFGKSVVYKTYKKLPDRLHLSGLEKTRNAIRKRKAPQPDENRAEDNTGSQI